MDNHLMFMGISPRLQSSKRRYARTYAQKKKIHLVDADPKIDYQTLCHLGTGPFLVTFAEILAHRDSYCQKCLKIAEGREEKD